MQRIQNSGCVIVDGEKLLVLFKKKHQHFEFPGGKVKEGETLEETALRETKEELGIEVELVRFICFKDFHINGKDYRSHKFLAKIKTGEKPKVAEPEIFEKLFWMPMKEYKNFSCAQNLKEFCEDFVQGKLDLNY